MTRKQFIALACLTEKEQPDGLISLFTGISRRICYRMDAYQIAKIWWMADWMTESVSFDRFVIPRIRAGKHLLCAPRPRFRRVSFGQFVFFDTCYIHYLESKSGDDLDRFVASLYIPRGAAFNDELPMSTERDVRSIPEKIKQALLFNYTLVRRWLAERYPLLFSLPEGEDPSGDEKTKSVAKGNPSVWIRVFDNLVGDDISRHEEYANIPLHNVMRYLTAKTKESMKR